MPERAVDTFDATPVAEDAGLERAVIKAVSDDLRSAEATYCGEYVMVDFPVTVREEDGYWVCEGYGLDYMAVGETRMDALKHFASGVKLTAVENGKRNQHGFK